jgi:hypothetical protein
VKKALFLFFGLAFITAIHLKGQVEMQGPVNQEEIYQNCPEWKAVADSYSPQATAIDWLKSFRQETRVEIYFGTWCSDSKSHVSEYFKIMELVANPFFITLQTGLPQDKQARQAYIGGKDVTKLPTFIVIVNGQEKGRIIEIPKKSVEEDLVDILAR